MLANVETSHRVVCELSRWCARRDERQKQAMTVAKDIQENLKVSASAITTISAVLNDEKLENAPTRDRAELLVHVAASLRDMAAALGTTAQLLEKLATEGGD